MTSRWHSEPHPQQKSDHRYFAQNYPLSVWRERGSMIRVTRSSSRTECKHFCLIKNPVPIRRIFHRANVVCRQNVRAVVEYLQTSLSIINASPCCVGIRVINCLRLMLRIREGSDLRAVNVEAYNRRHSRRFIYTSGS